MTLTRKHFQISDEHMEFIMEELKKREPINRNGKIIKWSESDIVREALDFYKKYKDKINDN
jgi:hypothetical protein